MCASVLQFSGRFKADYSDFVYCSTALVSRPLTGYVTVTAVATVA